MKDLKNTTESLGIKDKHITVLSAGKHHTHIVIKAKQDHEPLPCPRCQGSMSKYTTKESLLNQVKVNLLSY
ncbi:hypothetical protein [Streptococcus equi]|uniref:hypothetical protein n=1 Tax=Streptococcus equi TaxID=1336 RepID=UPI000AABD926|nr:hypothetical protein [Streptococcus equi]